MESPEEHNPGSDRQWMRLRAAILLATHELERSGACELDSLKRVLLQANLLVRIRLTSDQAAEAVLLAGRLHSLMNP